MWAVRLGNWRLATGRTRSDRCWQALLHLTQHRSYLTAMVGSVIHDVLKHLRERLGLGNAGHCFVMHDSREIFGLQRGDICEQVALNFGPVCAAQASRVRRLAQALKS